MLKLKRAYEKAEKSDGYRVLVDRLWPRGMSKAKLHIDEWPKEIAPSTDIRKKFGHQVKNWKTFCVDYRRELKASDLQPKIKELAKKARKEPVTLIYAAKDEVHNHAQVLKKYIESL